MPKNPAPSHDCGRRSPGVTTRDAGWRKRLLYGVCDFPEGVGVQFAFDPSCYDPLRACRCTEPQTAQTCSPRQPASPDASGICPDVRYRDAPPALADKQLLDDFGLFRRDWKISSLRLFQNGEFHEQVVQSCFSNSAALRRFLSIQAAEFKNNFALPILRQPA